MSDPTLDERMQKAEQILTEVAAGNLEQRLELSDKQDAFASLEMGINFMIMDLRALSDRESQQTQELHDRHTELQEQLELITKQRQAISELSTPVMQIWDGILVLPLIGAVDTLRAQQIIESLLQAIVEVQAMVAIIDITGVPMVDTAVANHLLKTIQAAKMLGAEAILTGVSPHNAQTLVTLEVNLSEILTKGSLQDGLRLALTMVKNDAPSLR